MFISFSSDQLVKKILKNVSLLEFSFNIFILVFLLGVGVNSAGDGGYFSRAALQLELKLEQEAALLTRVVQYLNGIALMHATR